MKKLLAFVLICLAANLQAQTLTGFSASQSAVIRDLVKRSADSVRKEFAAALKPLNDELIKNRPIINSIVGVDAATLKEVLNLVVTIKALKTKDSSFDKSVVSTATSLDSFLKSDKVRETAYNKMFNNKADTLTVINLSKAVSSAVDRITPLEKNSASKEDVKVIAEKVEAVKLTIPNGLTYPKQ